MRIEINPDDLNNAAGLYRQHAQRIDTVRSALASRRSQTFLDTRDISTVRAAPLETLRSVEDRLGQRAEVYRSEAQRLDATAANFRGIEEQPWGVDLAGRVMGAGSRAGLPAIGHGGSALDAVLSWWGSAAGVGAAGLAALAVGGSTYFGRHDYPVLRPGDADWGLPNSQRNAAAVTAWLVSAGTPFGPAAWAAMYGTDQSAFHSVRAFVDGCVQRCAGVLHSGERLVGNVGRWVVHAEHSAVSSFRSVAQAVWREGDRVLHPTDWREAAAGAMLTTLIPAGSGISVLINALHHQFGAPWPFHKPEPWHPKVGNAANGGTTGGAGTTLGHLGQSNGTVVTPAVDVPGATSGSLGALTVSRMNDDYAKQSKELLSADLANEALGGEDQYQCVAWAMFRWRQLHPNVPIAHGNGGVLAANNHGSATIPPVPTLGAMASYPDSGVGHVMIVEEITKTSTGALRIRVSEMNEVGGKGTDWDHGNPSRTAISWLTYDPKSNSWFRDLGNRKVGVITFAAIPGANN